MAKLGIALGVVVGAAYVWAVVVDDSIHPASPVLAGLDEACTRFQNLKYYRSELRYFDEWSDDEFYEQVVAGDKESTTTFRDDKRWHPIYHEFEGIKTGSDDREYRAGWQYYGPGDDGRYKRRELRLNVGDNLWAINSQALCPFVMSDMNHPKYWVYEDEHSRSTITLSDRGIDATERSGLARRFDIRWDMKQFRTGEWRYRETRLWINDLGFLVQYDQITDDSSRRLAGDPLHMRHVISHHGFPGKVELPKEWKEGSWPEGFGYD